MIFFSIQYFYILICDLFGNLFELSFDIKRRKDIFKGFWNQMISD